MYGYVNINKLELKIKEFYEFRGFYCGLCRTLGDRHGFLSRFSLSYDMTFLIILLSSLYEPEIKVEEKRCFVHPVRKGLVLTNPFSEYAADMNIALAVEKCEDDWKDEKKAKALVGLAAYKKRYEKIKENYPRQCEAIRRELLELARLEEMKSEEYEVVSATFGRLMAEIFVYKKDEWEEELRKIGFFLGKFIYLIDAFFDLEEDLKKGNYNPFKCLKKEKDFLEKIKMMLTLTMGDCTAAFEKLPLVKDIDILRNILYDGVWMKFDTKMKKLEESHESL